MYNRLARSQRLLRPNLRLRYAAFHSSRLWLAKVTKPFLLADIGEGITEVELLSWSVKEGATVEHFDILLECQSDKASVEITSPFAGKLKKIYAGAGEVVKVGQPLCDIEVESDEVDSAEEPKTDSVPSADHARTDKAQDPPTGESSELVTPPDASEAVAEAPSQSNADHRAPIPPHHHDPNGQASSSTPSKEDSSGSVLATPAVRRLAREMSIDLSAVKGSGRDGRVMKEDLTAHKSKPKAAEEPQAPIASTSQATASTSKVPLSATRRAMYKAMSNSLAIPHFALSEELDVTALERLRQVLNANIPAKYQKTSEGSSTEQVPESSRFDRITMLPLLVKALSCALHSHPLFRSTLSGASASEARLTQRSSHDISIALSSSEGLYTPLIPSVESMNPFAIASHIINFQTIAKAPGAPKFTPAMMKPGTITLSNVGVVGGTYTHPVIPPTGQLAIGAIGQVQVLPRYKASHKASAKAAAISGQPDMLLELEPRLVMSVSFTADHRVVEGVELAKLVADWKRIVEQPELLAGLS